MAGERERMIQTARAAGMKPQRVFAAVNGTGHIAYRTCSWLKRDASVAAVEYFGGKNWAEAKKRGWRIRPVIVMLWEPQP